MSLLPSRRTSMGPTAARPHLRSITGLVGGLLCLLEKKENLHPPLVMHAFVSS